ncbi:hypothetical protein [Pseudomonas sp. NPDC087615]|uniref:hypothetical protein n=1 Tax=Pseudomonas sp. NPDC087615 TaxID=3364443 RepID=UPI00382C5E45
MSGHKPLPDMKIIRYRPDLEGLEVAARKSLLWPCNAFSLSMPVTRQDRLNLFERTVLRLAAAGHCDSAAMAALTAMPEQIVSAIQSRLVQLDFLDEAMVPRHQVTGLSWEDEEVVEEELCTVFVELITGRLLPFVLQGAPRFAQDPRQLDRFNVGFSVGSAGAARNCKGRLLQPGHEGQVPCAQDLQALIGVHLRHQRHRQAGVGAPGAACVATRAAGLVFSSEPQMVWLSLECVLQRGNLEPLLSDPFGHGFSNLFDESFKRLCRQDPDIDSWLGERFKDANVKMAGRVSPSEPPLDDRLARYLDDAHRALFKTQLEVRSTEDERNLQRALATCAASLYGAVEHGLHLVVQGFRPHKGLLDLLIEGDYRSNALLLAGVARKLGFSLNSKAAEILLEVAGGKFHAGRLDATVELQPLLALCLMSANADPNHPLRRLAASDPGWIDFLADFKRQRDRAQHGASLDNSLSSSAFPDLDSRIRTSLACLLPHLTLGKQAQTPRADRLDDRTQAYVDVVRRLGASRLGALSLASREILISLERERPVSEDPTNAGEVQDCSAMITHMASLLQIQMQDAQVGAPVYEPREADEKRPGLAANARQAGFKMAAADLPRALASVAWRQYRHAAAGRAATLGAQMLSFLLRLSPAHLQRCALTLPWLLVFTAELCELRRHGNDEVPLSVAQSEQMMDRMYALVRYFMEF